MACLLCRHALNNSVRRCAADAAAMMASDPGPSQPEAAAAAASPWNSKASPNIGMPKREGYNDSGCSTSTGCVHGARVVPHAMAVLVAEVAWFVWPKHKAKKKKKNQTKAKGLHAESLWLVVLLRHIKLGNQKGRASVSPGEHQCRGEEARTIMASHNNATGRDQREKKKRAKRPWVRMRKPWGSKRTSSRKKPLEQTPDQGLTRTKTNAITLACLCH